MRLSYGPKGMLQIDDARITFKNFSGTRGRYRGARSFALVIESQELAEELQNRGWNVTIKPPYEPGDDPLIILNVKVKFNEYGPKIMLVNGSDFKRLDEHSVSILDNTRIERVDLLDIAASPYTKDDGSEGISAYLRSMEAHMSVDRFDQKYNNYDNEEAPF